MKTLALEADNKFALMCVNADERGMMGQTLTACFSHRCSEFSASLFPTADNSTFGCVPCFNLFDDIFHLGAICADDFHKVPLSSSTPCNIASHAVYKAFSDVITLGEVMRQKPSQIKLLNRLNHIRIGKVDQKVWNEINDRAFNNLHDNEDKKINKENPYLIMLTETWDEANKYNYEILASLNVPVAVIPSTGRGRHHLPNAQLCQIPSKCVLACGSRVILTKNQPGLASLGLNNDAIGTVKLLCLTRGQAHQSSHR